MPGVPAFIIRRLYVKGSLRNTLNGWQFTHRNTLGSGYAKGLVPIRLDDMEEIPMERTSFENDGLTVSFDQVNEDNTFGLEMNREIIITVTGDQLTAGSHSVYFGCVVPGLGLIGFDFSDEVEGGK